MKFGIGLSIAVLGLAAGSAFAGTTTNGVWTPSGCGTEPTPPTIDTTSEAGFNKSLDADEQFRNKSKEYNDCLFKEATTDSTAVSAAAQGEKDRRAAALAKLDADIKTGMDQFGKKKK